MSYLTQATMEADAFLRSRITAAAADEGDADPVAWLLGNSWAVVVAPGWDDAWESAVAGDVENPGADPGVITDGMILAQVQAVRGA